jgi:hypothetical protein
LATSEENLNTHFISIIQRMASWRDIPSVGTGSIYVKLFDSVGSGSLEIPLPYGGGVSTNGDTIATGSWVSTGVYKASMALFRLK